MSSLRLAILSLLRRPASSAITILSIAVAIGCSGILLRLYRLSEERFTGMAEVGQAIVGAKANSLDILLGALNSEGDYPGFLPENLYKTLKAQQTVRFEDGFVAEPNALRAIYPFLYFAKFHDDRVLGTEAEFFNRSGKGDQLLFLSGNRFAQKNEAVLGSAVAEQYHLSVGDTLTAQAWFGDSAVIPSMVQLKISGILLPTKSNLDRLIYTDLSTAQSVVAQSNLSGNSSWGASVLHFFILYLNPNGFPSLEALINRRTVGQMIDVEKEKRKLEELTSVGKQLGQFISFFVLSIGALSVAGMLMVRFEAMSAQIAVLRAIGYRRNVVANWLIYEGFLIGIVACVFGAIIDFVGFNFARQMLGAAVPAENVVKSYIWYSYPVWGFAIFAAVLSILIPLFRIYRQDVHSTLRN